MKLYPSLFLLAAVLFPLATPTETQAAIVVGELDNFNVDLEGWAQGLPPSGSFGVTRPTTGGPAGTDDAFMRIQSDGFSSHGKLVAFNQSSAWNGSYSAAGVTTIAMAANNLGATNLQLRVAIGTGLNANSGTWYASTTAVALPAGSGWTLVEFPLAESGMTLVIGSAAYSTVLGGVVTIRLLHNHIQPDNNGWPIAATLGVDNITAIVPEPASWLLLTSGALASLLRRRRK